MAQWKKLCNVISMSRKSYPSCGNSFTFRCIGSYRGNIWKEPIKFSRIQNNGSELYLFSTSNATTNISSTINSSPELGYNSTQTIQINRKSTVKGIIGKYVAEKSKRCEEGVGNVNLVELMFEEIKPRGASFPTFRYLYSPQQVAIWLFCISQYNSAVFAPYLSEKHINWMCEILGDNDNSIALNGKHLSMLLAGMNCFPASAMDITSSSSSNGTALQHATIRFLGVCHQMLSEYTNRAVPMRTPSGAKLWSRALRIGDPAKATLEHSSAPRYVLSTSELVNAFLGLQQWNLDVPGGGSASVGGHRSGIEESASIYVLDMVSLLSKHIEEHLMVETPYSAASIPLAIHAVKGTANFNSEYPQIKALLNQLTRWLSRVNNDVAASGASESSWKWAPATVLSTCANLKVKMSDHRGVVEFLQALNSSIMAHSSADWKDDLTGRSGRGLSKLMCRALHGTKGLKSVHPEVRELLHQHTGALGRIVHHIASNITSSAMPLDYFLVSTAAMGFRSKNSKHIEVTTLLQNFTTVLNASFARCEPNVNSVVFSSRNPAVGLSWIMSGFNCMSSQDRCVREYISALVPYIDGQMKNYLPNSSSGNKSWWFPVIGKRLKSMSSEYREVRQLLRALEQPLSQCANISLNAKEVADALYGCQMLSNKHIETRRHVKMLSQQLAPSVSALSGCNSQDLSTAIFGLQMQHLFVPPAEGASAIGCGDTGLVTLLRDVVNPMLSVYQRNNADYLTPQGISNALYGSRHILNSRIYSFLDADSQNIVTSFISQLTDIIGRSVRYHISECQVGFGNTSDHIFSPQHVGNALYGLQNFSSSPHTVSAANGDYADGAATGSSLNQELLSVVNRMLEHTRKHSEQPLDAQELANCVFGLRSLHLSGLLNRALKHILSGAPVHAEEAARINEEKLNEVLRLVSNVTHKISGFGSESRAHTPVILNSQEFAMILHSLRGLSLVPMTLQRIPGGVDYERIVEQHSDALNAVTKLIETVLPSLATCTEPFTHSELSMCVGGLCTLSSKYPVVCHLLELINNRLTRYGIVAPPAAMSARSSPYQSTPPPGYSYDIGNLLLGIRHMSPRDSESVRQLLSHIAPLLPPPLSIMEIRGGKHNEAGRFSGHMGDASSHSNTDGIMAIQRLKTKPMDSSQTDNSQTQQKPAIHSRHPYSPAATHSPTSAQPASRDLSWNRSVEGWMSEPEHRYRLPYSTAIWRLKNILNTRDICEYSEVRLLLTQLQLISPQRSQLISSTGAAANLIAPPVLVGIHDIFKVAVGLQHIKLVDTKNNSEVSRDTISNARAHGLRLIDQLLKQTADHVACAQLNPSNSYGECRPESDAQSEFLLKNFQFSHIYRSLSGLYVPSVVEVDSSLSSSSECYVNSLCIALEGCLDRGDRIKLKKGQVDECIKGLICIRKADLCVKTITESTPSTQIKLHSNPVAVRLIRLLNRVLSESSIHSESNNSIAFRELPAALMEVLNLDGGCSGSVDCSELIGEIKELKDKLRLEVEFGVRTEN